jgi:hypothetical protein
MCALAVFPDKYRNDDIFGTPRLYLIPSPSFNIFLLLCSGQDEMNLTLATCF